MGGFFSPDPPSAPAVDTSLQDKQLANMEAQNEQLNRQNAARMRLLAGRGGSGSGMLRFSANDSAAVPAAGSGTAATLGG